MANSVTDNWMSTVNSGTYKWTLYVVNNDLYNSPDILAQNDSAALNSGNAVIVAESGVTGSYSVENVIIQSTITPGNGSGNTTPTGVVFEIYEPLGFSLLDRLLTVGRSMGMPQNIQGLAYVMKLEFLGRDVQTGASKKFPGVFLYKTRISNMKASLGPAGAKYFVTAMFDIRSTQLETVTPVDLVVTNVSTVETFASRLQSALNTMEINLLSPADQRGGARPLREYRVVLGDSTNIQAQPERRITAFDLSSQAWGGVANSDTASAESANLNNVDVRDIVINSETQLSAKISELIRANVPSWSTYVNESRNERFYVPDIYVNLSEELLEEDPLLNQIRKRITITVEVRINETTAPDNADNARTLQTNASLQQQRFDSLGIVKKYNYLYTGENSEIIDFQLDIEALFVTATSPAAGIYYADNSQQFTPTNPVLVSDGRTVSIEFTPIQQRTANARFLSDVELDRVNINYSTAFDRVPASAASQQKNEHTGLTDDIAAVIAQQTASRNVDNLNIMLGIRGDPFWLGTPDSVVVGADSRFVSNFGGNDALVGFVNFQPNEKDLLIRQQRGPVDMVGTGVYNITHVESKFQMGQFTQTLTGYKDPNTNVFLTLDQLINIEVI